MYESAHQAPFVAILLTLLVGACGKGLPSADGLEVGDVKLDWSEEDMVSVFKGADIACGDDWHVLTESASRAAALGFLPRDVPESDKDSIRTCSVPCPGASPHQAPAIEARFWRGSLFRVRRLPCGDEGHTLGYTRALYEEKLGVSIPVQRGIFSDGTFAELDGFSVELDRGRIIAVASPIPPRPDPLTSALSGIEWLDTSLVERIETEILSRERSRALVHRRRDALKHFAV